MMEYAHRYAWHLTHGPIPTGLYVCHACDVRACFNPDHLFLGTATANMRDALEKQRLSRGVRHSLTVRGEHNAHAVLTPDAVIDIRAGVQAGLSYAVVGAPWGVGKAGVAHVVRGRSWAHIASEASL
jgi:hypothetical protein